MNYVHMWDINSPRHLGQFLSVFNGLLIHLENLIKMHFPVQEMKHNAKATGTLEADGSHLEEQDPVSFWDVLFKEASPGKCLPVPLLLITTSTCWILLFFIYNVFSYFLKIFMLFSDNLYFNIPLLTCWRELQTLAVLLIFCVALSKNCLD